MDWPDCAHRQSGFFLLGAYDLTILGNLRKAKSFFRKIRNPVDLSDVFLFGGLCLLWHGLFLYRPWVSFTVCGVLLMVYGLMMGIKDKG